MEFETLLNSISELENQNRIEERKLSEEERRHQATKDELNVCQSTIQTKDLEIMDLWQKLSTSKIELEREERKAKSLKTLNDRITEELHVMREHFEREEIKLTQRREEYTLKMESVNEDLRKILAKPNHAVNLPNNNNIDDTQNLRFKIDSLEFQIEEMKRNKEQKESISMVVDSQGDKVQELESIIKKKDLEAHEVVHELERLDEYSKTLEASLDEMQKYCNSIELLVKDAKCQSCGAVFEFSELADFEQTQ